MNPGKAEPGRDIFAPQPQVDIKSEAMAIPDADDEPKAISSVGAPSSTEDPQKHDEEPAKTPGGELSSAVTKENTPSSSTSDDPESTESAAPSPEVPKAKIQGPLDAEQAEADEVRQELFPDAHE